MVRLKHIMPLPLPQSRRVKLVLLVGEALALKGVGARVLPEAKEAAKEEAAAAARVAEAVARVALARVKAAVAAAAVVCVLVTLLGATALMAASHLMTRRTRMRRRSLHGMRRRRLLRPRSKRPRKSLRIKRRGGATGRRGRTLNGRRSRSRNAPMPAVLGRHRSGSVAVEMERVGVADVVASTVAAAKVAAARVARAARARAARAGVEGREVVGGAITLLPTTSSGRGTMPVATAPRRSLLGRIGRLLRRHMRHRALRK